MTFPPCSTEKILFIVFFLIHVISVGVTGLTSHSFKLPPFIAFGFVGIHHHSETVLVPIVPIALSMEHSGNIATEQYLVLIFFDATQYVSVRLQRQRATEILMEKSAFHSKVTTLDDKASCSNVIQENRLSCGSVLALAYHIVVHVDAFPFSAWGMSMCLLLLLLALSKGWSTNNRRQHEHKDYAQGYCCQFK